MMRVAAASATALFVTLGAVAPVRADTGGKSGNDASPHATSSSASKAAGQSTGHRATTPKPSSRAQSSGRSQSSGESQPSGSAADAHGNGHTPVTLCHRLGNGGYHLLTVDDNAARAHLAHGDVMPSSDGTCPAGTTHTGGGSSVAGGRSGSETTGAHGEGRRGPGHTRATVCHLLGNGGYHLLTFDEHALPAHLAHGDVMPSSDGTCPAAGSTLPGGSAPQAGGTTSESGDTAAEAGAPTTISDSSQVTPATTAVVAEALTEVPTRVLGVRQAETARSPQVKGVEAVRAGAAPVAAGRPARLAPAAGFLPNTGAGRVMAPLLAGLALVAAGASLLLRRRAARRG